MTGSRCRLCLLSANKHKIVNIYEKELKFNITEFIKNYFNIEISENDTFSKILCYKCFVKIDDFNNFISEVKVNNEFLIKSKEIIHSFTDVKVINKCDDTNCEMKDNHSDISDTCDGNKENDNELFSDKESKNNSESILHLEPQIILEESDASSDIDSNLAKKKKRNNKDVKQKYPETPNDVQIKKFYKYECDLCKDHQEISTFRLLKIHYKTKHGIAAYIKCCGKRFTRPYALVEHIDEHLTPDSLICPTCNKKLRTKQTLLLHMDTHVPVEKRPLKCKYCDMRFVRNHFLIQHEKVHLTDDQLKYICDLCGKRFPTHWRLKTHLNSTHSDEKPFVCEVCAKNFKLKVQLQNHMYIHNSKEDAHKQCEHCGTWLRSPRSYYVHMKEKHDKAAPKSYPCDKCPHVSPTRKALYAHSINKHGPKKHNCAFCPEAFTSSNLLKSHMIKHTGPGAPLKCPFCPKTFSFRSGFYSHKKKVHSNVTEPSKKGNNSA